MGWEVCADNDPDAEGVLPSRTVDSFKFENVSAIKLDLEGHEFEALQGAIKTITKWKPLIMVEDKSDIRPGNLPLKYLVKLGMHCTWSFKHDYLFEWLPRG